jgi:hypothetical protein
VLNLVSESSPRDNPVSRLRQTLRFFRPMAHIFIPPTKIHSRKQIFHQGTTS